MSDEQEKEIADRMNPLIARLKSATMPERAEGWGGRGERVGNLRALAAAEMEIIARYIDRRFTWARFGRHNTMRAVHELIKSIDNPINRHECREHLGVELLAIEAKDDRE